MILNYAASAHHPFNHIIACRHGGGSTNWIRSTCCSQHHCLVSGRVRPIDRIISDIGVKIQVIRISDGVRLHEPPKARIVHPRLVVIQARLRYIRLRGELKSPLI